MLSKFRALWRIARRDLREHWIRTLVMVILVAIPVAAINGESFASTEKTSEWAQSYLQLRDGSQATAKIVATGPIGQNGQGNYNLIGSSELTSIQKIDPKQLKEAIKTASTSASYISPAANVQIDTTLPIEFDTGNDTIGSFEPQAHFNDYETWWRVEDPELIAGPFSGLGIEKILAGEMPRQAGQVFIDQGTATRLNLKVGDKIKASYRYRNWLTNGDGAIEKLSEPAELTVSGIGLTSTKTDSIVLVNNASFPKLREAQEAIGRGSIKVIDRADTNSLNLLLNVVEDSKFYYWRGYPVDFERIKEANKAGIVVYSRQVLTDSDQTGLNNGYVEPEVKNLGEAENDGYGLAIFIYSLLVGLAVLLTVLLVPISALFSQSMLPTGALVTAVGATRKQWRLVVVLAQLTLILFGVILGSVIGSIWASIYLWVREGLPFMHLPFVWWLVIAEAIAALIIATVSGFLGNHQVEKVLARSAGEDTAPSKKVFYSGLALVVIALALVFSSFAFRSQALFVFSPLLVVIALVGVSMTVPLTLTWLDGSQDRRIRKESGEDGQTEASHLGDSEKVAEEASEKASEKGKIPQTNETFPKRTPSEFVMGAQLAWRDLRRRRHRVTPTVTALVILVGGATVMTPMLGIANTWEDASGPSPAIARGAVLIKPTSLRADTQIRENELNTMSKLVHSYVNVDKGTDIRGFDPQVVTKANLSGLTDPTRWGSKANRVAERLGTNPNALGPQKGQPARGQGKQILTVGAYNPSGTYRGCPGVSPHLQGIASALPYDFNIDTVTDPKQAEHCRWLQKRIAQNGLSLGLNPETVIVDDGNFLKNSGQTTGADLDKALQTLKTGGVLVNDPALIEGGKTTVAVTLVSENLENGKENQAGSLGKPENGTEVKTLTVPATYWPVPVGKLDNIIASPQVAKELGFKTYPVARVLVPQGNANWFAGVNLIDRFGQTYGGDFIMVNQPSADIISSYLFMAFTVTLVTMFVALMLVVLAGLELRKSLRIIGDVGASPRLLRWFGAWFTGSIITLGMLLGIVTGTIILEVFALGNTITADTATEPLFGFAANHIGVTAISSCLLWVPILAGALGAWLIPGKINAHRKNDRVGKGKI